MASTPATGAIGVELQAAGENLNTWGDPKLNNALQILVNLAHGWKAWTINGNYTVSETNYSTTNDTENAFIKLVAGTVAAAFNVTIPGRAKRLFMWNATSYAATVKLAATTGVTIPAGGFAIVATDGSTDVYNVGPTHAGTTTQSTSANAYALWGAVETAIATASLPATAGTLLTSAADTTAGYHAAKHTVSASGDLTAAFSITSPSADEDLLLTLVHTPYFAAPTVVTTGTTAAADRGIYLCRTSTGAITIQLPASGRVQIIDVDGLADTNNITVDPPAGGSIMDGAADENMALDINWFSATFTQRTAGTNWSVS